MAVAGTTLSSAVGLDASSIVVASATGFAIGSYVRVSGEMMQITKAYTSGTTIPVRRGINGTVNQVHAAGAYTVVGTATDFGDIAPVTVTNYPIAGRARTVQTYNADGAITLPIAGNDATVILTKTSAQAMTLADPTKDMDGTILFIISGTKVAHTITSDGGFGGNTTNTDVLTFNSATAQAVMCIACNTRWLLIGSVGGSATVSAPGLA